VLFKGEHEGAELSMPKLLSVSSSCLSYSLYADTIRIVRQLSRCDCLAKEGTDDKQ